MEDTSWNRKINRRCHPLSTKGQAAIKWDCEVSRSNLILGCDWLVKQLQLKEVMIISKNCSLQSLLERYSKVFQDSLGELKGFKARIHVDLNVQT